MYQIPKTKMLLKFKTTKKFYKQYERKPEITTQIKETN